ncbi:hypothetical protein N4239_11900 [Brachyspira hyodysenteriae]|uniref:hypothetical protein n=1 Tax=Brachyspira hyodysenteriae TaxID=159 RepID=UPI002B25A3DF|nr:hypothetical protein [Brachyspira hyodysenteriae]WPC23637.1 hypothetical protein N4239_11900 [Brachyspira hyodysenteriae]
MNMKVNNEEQYIHIERDNKEKHIIIDTKNISSEDTVYLLTEFICFVSNKENIPTNVFLLMIGKAIMKKEELENKKNNNIL